MSDNRAADRCNVRLVFEYNDVDDPEDAPPRHKTVFAWNNYKYEYLLDLEDELLKAMARLVDLGREEVEASDS